MNARTHRKYRTAVGLLLFLRHVCASGPRLDNTEPESRDQTQHLEETRIRITELVLDIVEGASTTDRMPRYVRASAANKGVATGVFVVGRG